MQMLCHVHERTYLVPKECGSAQGGGVQSPQAQVSGGQEEVGGVVQQGGPQRLQPQHVVHQHLPQEAAGGGPAPLPGDFSPLGSH